jgi:hypothetical protein
MGPRDERGSIQDTADRVGDIIAAAERSAEEIRHEAEARAAERIAEADRAAE